MTSCGSVLEQRRQFRLGPLRRRGEVEVQPLLLGVADEVPVRVEAPAVAVAELVEDDAAGPVVAVVVAVDVEVVPDAGGAQAEGGQLRGSTTTSGSWPASAPPVGQVTRRAQCPAAVGSGLQPLMGPKGIPIVLVTVWPGARIGSGRTQPVA